MPAQPSGNAGSVLRLGGGCEANAASNAAREAPAGWQDLHLDMDALADDVDKDLLGAGVTECLAACRQPVSPADSPPRSISGGGGGGDVACGISPCLPKRWREADRLAAALVDSTNEQPSVAASTAAAAAGWQPPARPPAGRTTSGAAAVQRAPFAAPRLQHAPQAAPAAPAGPVAAAQHTSGSAAAASAAVQIYASGQELRRTGEVPDSFQSLQQYQRTWTAALNEEASLRCASLLCTRAM